MAMAPQPYNFGEDPNALDSAYKRVRGFQQDAAARNAGNALKSGDYTGASAALLESGNVDAGVQLQRYGAQEADRKAAAGAAQEDRAAKALTQAVVNLRKVHDGTPEAGRTAAVLQGWDYYTPRLRALGETPEEIAETRAMLEKDPNGTLTLLGGELTRKYQMANGGDGYIGRFDPEGGTLETLREGQPKPIQLDPTKSTYLPGAPAGAQPAAAPAATQSDPEVVWRSIVAQESGGDPTPGNAVSEKGALGSTQMLPATAEAMARKLGLRWDPRLMRENTPQALAYQQKLGRAYFDEGMERSGGDPAAAAAYYFAGPDQAQHGPKTQAYVQQVMARAGAAGGPVEVAANGPTSLPGYRMVSPGQPKQMKRPATAQEKAQYQIAADVPAEYDPADGSIKVITGVGAANKRVPAPVQKGYIENNSNIAQIDRAIALVKAHKGAMGLANVMGDEIRQRQNPQGIKTRAAVAEVGALKIHDLSGAAVTASETPRLKPFIPMPTDNDEATIAKLEQLKDHIRSNNAQIDTQYGEESGYAPLNRTPAAAAASAAKPAAQALRKDPNAIRDATIAIRRGAPKDKVIARLRENGIDPAGL